jgi:hypothetical protein
MKEQLQGHFAGPIGIGSENQARGSSFRHQKLDS